MDFRRIPAGDDHFYDPMEFLRNQIAFAVKSELNASPQTVEDALDRLLSEPVLEVLSKWHGQKSQLEADLIGSFLNIIVPRSMEPDRKKDDRYQYSLHSEGWCLHPSHKQKPHFIKGGSLANTDAYTLEELMENWEDIFVRDQDLDENPQLQSTYTPRHSHQNIYIPGLLTVTRHELIIVDSNRNFVPGSTISYARAKSGISYLFKIAEWLTGLRADGSDRLSVDDYLAALSRFSDYKEMWVRTIQMIDDFSEITPGDLRNIIRLQRYSIQEAKDLTDSLKVDQDVGGFVSGRGDLRFEMERLPEGGKNERKFGEILLPVGGNVVGYQIYGESDYTRSEGMPDQRHDRYRGRKERQMLDGFTPWHWSIVRRLAEYFVDPKELLGPFKEIYEPYLSLRHFEQSKR